MSIMVPAPMTAPMFTTAPIMTTALSPISTCSRMMAPGSIRAFRFFLSSRGMAELRLSFSTTTWLMLPALASRTGPISFQSPNTILLSPQGNTTALGNSTGAVSLRNTRTGVFFSAVRMRSMISCAFIQIPP